MLSVLMQVMVTFSMIVVLWFLYGYSFGLHRGQPVHRRHFAPVHGRHLEQRCGHYSRRTPPRSQQGGGHPEIVSAAFQATFAGITCTLIVVAPLPSDICGRLRC